MEYSKPTAEKRLLLYKPHYQVSEVAFGGGGFVGKHNIQVAGITLGHPDPTRPIVRVVMEDRGALWMLEPQPELLLEHSLPLPVRHCD